MNYSGVSGQVMVLYLFIGMLPYLQKLSGVAIKCDILVLPTLFSQWVYIYI